MEETLRPDGDAAFAETGPARSPLDGVRGLLLLLAGFLALRVLVSCGTFLSALTTFAGGENALARVGLAALLYLPDAALAACALILLLRRRIAFRIPYVISAAFRLCAAGLSAFRAFSGGMPFFGAAYVCFAAVLGAAIVYVFRSERVRVTCGLPPRRPLSPLPTEPHWNADGTRYTDERGDVTTFAPATRIRAARFPAGHAAARGKRPAANRSKEEGAFLQ